MLKKIRKSIAMLLLMSLSFGMSTTAMAADTTEEEEVTVINLFDENDPNLVSIDEPVELTRSSTRPTAEWNLDKSRYLLSVHSNNNIAWTDYRFLTQNDSGKFLVEIRSSTNTNYYICFHNCLNGRDYHYRVKSATDFIYNSNVPNWPDPYLFYFGIDTTQTGGSVSVTGTVQTF